MSMESGSPLIIITASAQSCISLDRCTSEGCMMQPESTVYELTIIEWK